VNNYRREQKRRQMYDRGVRAGDVIYAARRLSDGAIKIGKTSKLQSRMRQLKQKVGDVELLATTPGYTHREREVHQELDQYRIYETFMIRNRRVIKYAKPQPTEYFRPEPGLMAWIEANMTPYVEPAPKRRKQPIKFTPTRPAPIEEKAS
jgi:hypothetical protein